MSPYSSSQFSFLFTARAISLAFLQSMKTVAILHRLSSLRRDRSASIFHIPRLVGKQGREIDRSSETERERDELQARREEKEEKWLDTLRKVLNKPDSMNNRE